VSHLVLTLGRAPPPCAPSSGCTHGRVKNEGKLWLKQDSSHKSFKYSTETSVQLLTRRLISMKHDSWHVRTWSVGQDLRPKCVLCVDYKHVAALVTVVCCFCNISRSVDLCNISRSVDPVCSSPHPNYHHFHFYSTWICWTRVSGNTRVVCARKKYVRVFAEIRLLCVCTRIVWTYFAQQRKFLYHFTPLCKLLYELSLDGRVVVSSLLIPPLLLYESRRKPESVISPWALTSGKSDSSSVHVTAYTGGPLWRPKGPWPPPT
jgi:hypothetical protein